MTGSIALAFVAGLLSILSPCVLPILPIVLGAAAAETRSGPAALAAGLCVAFVAIGLFVATIGYSIGLDLDVFRRIAGALMITIGAVLALPPLSARLSLAGAPVGNWADKGFDRFRRHGALGQLIIGVLLGAVWAPCVGPTLGAASLLAAQGRDLVQVAAVMLAFGLGAALPLLAIGLLSREAMLRWRARLVSAGQGAKAALGLLIAAVGFLAVTGWDKSVETVLVNASPDWLTMLTTRF
jgi:cytochrome c-type biogenesis protein